MWKHWIAQNNFRYFRRSAGPIFSKLLSSQPGMLSNYLTRMFDFSSLSSPPLPLTSRSPSSFKPSSVWRAPFLSSFFSITCQKSWKQRRREVFAGASATQALAENKGNEVDDGIGNKMDVEAEEERETRTRKRRRRSNCNQRKRWLELHYARRASPRGTQIVGGNGGKFRWPLETSAS